MRTVDLLASSLVILLTPLPFAHALLHSALSTWRRRPGNFYTAAIVVWLVVSMVLWSLPRPVLLFEPGNVMRTIGVVAMVAGAVLVPWAIATLHPKRFFLWAVLHPESVEQVRIGRGPYRLLAHPAYTGYELIALGAFIASGIPEALALTGWLLISMPVVIRLEEQELANRIHGRSS